MIEVSEWAERITALIEGQLKLWAGLVASVSGALVTSTDALDDGPVRHTIQIVFIVSTAVTAYLIRRPTKE